MKLLQYGLSPNLVKTVIRKPDRVENGIAPKTTAVMKRKDSKKTKKEVWVMMQKHKTYNMKHEIKIHPVKLRQSRTAFGGFNRVKIISAWIYPGVSPKGKDIYVPEDVWGEL
jgi:hypothetical protein